MKEFAATVPAAIDILVNWLNLIVNWVEKNEAQERVIMSKSKNNQVIMTRPVYPYPKVVKYDGKGNPKLESSFKLIE